MYLLLSSATLHHARDVKNYTYHCCVLNLALILKVWGMPWPINSSN